MISFRRLHEVFHNIVHTSRRQSLIVSMVVEKCEWDLYFFLRALPRDMPETQTKMLAKQVLFCFLFSFCRLSFVLIGFRLRYPFTKPF